MDEVRISCAECHMFVDLPDQTAVLGRFACADCRRERHHAGSPQPPPVRARLAQRVPTALAERRARRLSSPPPPAPLPVPVAGVGISPATSVAEPGAPRVESGDSRGAPSAADEPAPPARTTPGGSSTPAWVLPEEALAVPARAANSASRRGGLAAVGVALAAAALAALLAIRSTPQEPATAATPERVTPVGSGATAPAAVSPSTAAGARPVTEVDRATMIQEELGRVAQQADRCRKPGDPAGVARLRLTFAPSGHAREISIERGAYSAPKDRVGNCLVALFRRARIEPFSGQPVTVTKSVVVR